MAKIKYRSGDSIVELLDIDPIMFYDVCQCYCNETTVGTKLTASMTIIKLPTP